MKQFYLFSFNYNLLICIFCIQIAITNSRTSTSTLWKLNPENDRIISFTNNNNNNNLQQQQHPEKQHHQKQQQQQQQHNYKQQHVSQTNHEHLSSRSMLPAPSAPYDNDLVFDIISSTVINKEYGDNRIWRKQASSTIVANSVCIDTFSNNNNNNNHNNINKNDEHSKNVSTPLTVSTAKKSTITAKTMNNNKIYDESNEILDCGKPVNFTYYDHFIGVAQRYNHPKIPEPEVAHVFIKNKNGLERFDINALEKRLKKAKREHPPSVQLYNQIGNYWRIKGDAKQSIECFRRALALSPVNSDVLLNLARVLFNLQYLDDAIQLTRRSIEVQPPDSSAWRQYFTLGEIFKAYGSFQESVFNLRRALDLQPEHEEIRTALRDVENIPSTELNTSTLLIIIGLVISVLCVILNIWNCRLLLKPEVSDVKGQRRFTRAQAMKSLKGGESRSIKNSKK